jgi:hypothetical protein
MGPTKISGLPAHILLVHVVVTVVPLAAALVTVAAVWPAARRWLNWLPVLAALGALAAVPITTNAGRWLQHHLRGQVTPAISHHIALGNQVLPWALALFAASVVVWATARAEGLRSAAIGRGRLSDQPARDAGDVALGGGRRTGVTRRSVRVVVAIVAITAAAGAVQQVYRTGEAGSRAVWSGVFQA